MRILICGSRNYTNKKKIMYNMKYLPKDTIIIQGGCRGADTLAKECAIELGLEYIQYDANWEAYGRAAGVMRNKLMLNHGEPDIVLAFHENLANSRGTKNMLDIARFNNVPTFVWG